MAKPAISLARVGARTAVSVKELPNQRKRPQRPSRRSFVYLGCCRTVFENGREEEGVPGKERATTTMQLRMETHHPHTKKHAPLKKRGVLLANHFTMRERSPPPKGRAQLPRMARRLEGAQLTR